MGLHAMRPNPVTPEPAGRQATPHTPESLIGQRVEPPSLDEQLAAYEARHALLDDDDEVDPHTRQWVGLVVATSVGVVLAMVVAAAVAGALWML